MSLLAGLGPHSTLDCSLRLAPVGTWYRLLHAPPTCTGRHK